MDTGLNVRSSSRTWSESASPSRGFAQAARRWRRGEELRKQQGEGGRARKSQSSDAILKLRGIANRGEVGQSRSREDSESPCPVHEEGIFMSTVMIYDIEGGIVPETWKSPQNPLVSWV